MPTYRVIITVDDVEAPTNIHAANAVSELLELLLPDCGIQAIEGDAETLDAREAERLQRMLDARRP